MLADAQIHGKSFIEKNPDSFSPCTFSRIEAKDYYERLKNLKETLIPNQIEISMNRFKFISDKYKENDSETIDSKTIENIELFKA